MNFTIGPYFDTFDKNFITHFFIKRNIDIVKLFITRPVLSKLKSYVLSWRHRILVCDIFG